MIKKEQLVDHLWSTAHWHLRRTTRDTLSNLVDDTLSEKLRGPLTEAVYNALEYPLVVYMRHLYHD